MNTPYTTQERTALRHLGALVWALDYRRGLCTRLEHRIARLPDCVERRALLTALFAQRRHEQQALLDLRDGAAHVFHLSAALTPREDA